MSAFDNNINLKKEILQKIKKSKNLIKQGESTFWNWKIGSPIGVIIQHETRSLELFSEKYGFSKELIEITEYVFNNMEEKKALQWIFNFFKKIEVGDNTKLTYNKIKNRILLDDKLGLLSKVMDNIKCSVTNNIIIFISERLKNNKMFAIEDLMKSTLNPLVNTEISQEEYQDIIDIINIIQNNKTDIYWALSKIEINNIIKIIDDETEISI